MSIFKDKYGKSLSFKEAMPKLVNRLYNCLLDFELFNLHCVGKLPSHLVRRFVFGLGGIKIGRGSTIHVGARFFDPKNISIGEDSVIGYRCFLDGRDKLAIGNHVDIASEVIIYNSQHDIDDPFFTAESKPVQIKDYVFIGPRAVILPGVTIGKGAVVGAGAVVTKDVADYTVVGGIPARKIRERKLKDLNYRLGRVRLFQ